MNKVLQFATPAALLLLGGIALAPVVGAQTNPHPMHPRPTAPPAAAAPPAAYAPANAATMAGAYSTIPGKKTPAGEQFFIVASLDLQKSQLLLKHPTEVTFLVKATPQTQLLDDSGKPMKLSDFRAGDTVWVTSTGSGDAATALKVRKGQMTVADLHRYYLDYSAIN